MGDFKFIAIAIIFISLFSIISYNIAIDDSITAEDITGTYNNTEYTSSTNTNNFDILKEQFTTMSASGLLVLSTIGTIFTTLFVFVVLRFIRGQ